MATTTTYYLYLKTHKFGGTSVTQMLVHALLEQRVAPCETRWVANVTRAGLANQPCAACLCYEALKEIGLWARTLGAINVPFARHCTPLAHALPVPSVRTAIVLRDPVERAWGQYHYTRGSGWCAARAWRQGHVCAADELDFLDWVRLTDPAIRARNLSRSRKAHITGEVTLVLGGSGDEAGLKAATRALRALTVVGITERMDEFVVMLAKGWDLPLPLLARHYRVANARTRPRADLSTSDRDALLGTCPLLRREHRLYREAARLVKDRARVIEDLAAQRLSLMPLQPRTRPTRTVMFTDLP